MWLFVRAIFGNTKALFSLGCYSFVMISDVFRRRKTVEPISSTDEFILLIDIGEYIPDFMFYISGRIVPL